MNLVYVLFNEVATLCVSSTSFSALIFKFQPVPSRLMILLIIYSTLLITWENFASSLVSTILDQYT